jgi:hypothetical protein
MALSSTSTLVQLSEGSTVGENDYDYAVPPQPDTPAPPGEFEFDSDSKENAHSPIE